MRVKRGPVPELFRAEVAVEPLFTGMDHMVALQVGCRLEGFATHLALEWPVVTVDHALVTGVHLLADEFATKKQKVGIFANQSLSWTYLPAEYFPTEGAVKHVFEMRHLSVVCKAGGIREGPGTLLAPIGSSYYRVGGSFAPFRVFFGATAQWFLQCLVKLVENHLEVVQIDVSGQVQVRQLML